MIINVKVTTKASKNEVLKVDENNFKVKVTIVAEKGKANERVIELLAKYFKIGKLRVRILKGLSSSRKTVEIN